MSLFRRKQKTPEALLQEHTCVSLHKDPDNANVDFHAQRQSSSAFWDVFKETQTWHESRFVNGNYQTSGWDTAKTRIVSGVSLAEAVETLAAIESAWADKVRGLNKADSHYALVRALLPAGQYDEATALRLRQARALENIPTPRPASVAATAPGMAPAAVPASAQTPVSLPPPITAEFAAAGAPDDYAGQFESFLGRQDASPKKGKFSL